MSEQTIVSLKNEGNEKYRRNLNTVKRKGESLELKKSIERGKNNEWLFEVASEMGVPGKTDLAYLVLKAVLHSIRDTLDLQEIFNLSSYLPVYVRGIYFEGFNPNSNSIAMYNNEMMKRFHKRMGSRNCEYFEQYLNQCKNDLINREVIIKSVREKLGADKDLDAGEALKAVISVLCNKIPDGDLNNEKIKSLLQAFQAEH